MAVPDERYLLRQGNIEREKSASKVTRAVLEFRKFLTHWSFVRRNPVPGALSPPPGRDMFITVAFNDAKLIALQAEALQKFVGGDFDHVVVDNSPDPNARLEVKRVAELYGLYFIAAPHNPYSWHDPSRSHSLVLDWVWRNFIRRVGPRVVILLDHDLFPIENVKVGSLLGSATAAGYRRESERHWILWPGLLAMDFQKVERCRPSFMPRDDTDSGGSMWWRLYSKIPERELRFLAREDLVFGDTSNRSGDGSAGEVHLLDRSWLHLVDGSGWSDGVGKIGKIPLSEPSLTLDGLIDFARLLRHKK